MDRNNSNSDKITIKVKVPDDDYLDISIDWSNDSFDYRKQIFHSIAEYTGVPIEHTVLLQTTHYTLNGFHPSIVIANRDKKDYSGPWAGDKKEIHMNFFQDGDCFMLETQLEEQPDGLEISYYLTNMNFVDETQCTRVSCIMNFCHYNSSRAINNRLAELLKSDHVHSEIERNASLGESRRRDLALLFNFRQYFWLPCSLAQNRQPYHRHHLYLRNRG